MAKLRQRPRAHRKGRSPEQSCNGQSPPESRAHRKGKTPEQPSKVEAPPEASRPKQGQAAGDERVSWEPASPSRDLLPARSQRRESCRRTQGKVASKRNRKRRTHAQPATPSKPQPREAAPRSAASNASQASASRSRLEKPPLEAALPTARNSHYHSRSSRHQVTAGPCGRPNSSLGRMAGGLTRAVTQRGTDSATRPLCVHLSI